MGAANMLATESDAIREWTSAVGCENRDRAWLLSNYDTWERNPYYVGAPVPHPDSEEWQEYAQSEVRALTDIEPDECPF
jgi:hypothetical protein